MNIFDWIFSEEVPATWQLRLLKVITTPLTVFLMLVIGLPLMIIFFMCYGICMPFFYVVKGECDPYGFMDW